MIIASSCTEGSHIHNEANVHKDSACEVRGRRVVHLVVLGCRMQGLFARLFWTLWPLAVGGLKAGHRVALMPWLWLRPCLVLEGHSRPYLVVIVGSVTIKESFDVGIAFPHLHAQNGSKWTWGIMSTTYSSTGGFHPGHTNNQTV